MLVHPRPPRSIPYAQSKKGKDPPREYITRRKLRLGKRMVSPGCANNVTDSLGYANGRKAMADHVDEDERRSVTIS
jgi:hypothetical protein